MRFPRRLPTSLCAIALLVGLAGLVAGCGKSHPDAATQQQDAATKVLQARSALASKLSFVGTYTAVATTGRKATVLVWVTPTNYRVEIVDAGVTAALYGSPTGTVACPEKSGVQTVCYTVAAAGKSVPAEFDAGVQRIFTQDLPTLAKDSDAFDIIESTPSASVISAAADARCFSVLGPNTSAPLVQPVTSLVDTGTYCLSSTGLPVLFEFASGTLTLTTHSGAPTAVEMAPPVLPEPLPVTLASTTASPSPSTTFPVVLPSGSAAS